MTPQELENEKLHARIDALTLVVKLLLVTHPNRERVAQRLRDVSQGYEDALLLSTTPDKALAAGSALLRVLLENSSPPGSADQSH